MGGYLNQRYFKLNTPTVALLWGMLITLLGIALATGKILADTKDLPAILRDHERRLSTLEGQAKR